MATLPPQMLQGGTPPATANSPVARSKFLQWQIENIQRNLNGVIKHMKSNPNHPCAVMVFAFRDLEALLPHTTVDTIRSTGIRSTLTQILAIRNLPGDVDYHLKLRANNLFNKYEAMILRSDPGVDKILRSDVDQMEKENKDKAKEVPTSNNERLTDKAKADQAAVYNRKVLAGTSSLAGTWSESAVQPVQPAQFSKISFTMSPQMCYHNSASTEDGKNETLSRCQTTVARWKVEDLNITQTTASPAITSLATTTSTTTTSVVLEQVSSDSDDADQELEKEQDEPESEYEVVNIEKEDGDDWIVVGDDAF